MMTTVYCLRIRDDDKSPWGPTTYYKSRKDRNYDEQMNRIIAGMRTYSFTEKKSTEEVTALTNAGELN